MNPPEHAIVLCGDQRSQVQSLDRTQRGLLLQKWRAQTHKHPAERKWLRRQ